MPTTSAPVCGDSLAIATSLTVPPIAHLSDPCCGHSCCSEQSRRTASSTVGTAPAGPSIAPPDIHHHWRARPFLSSADSHEHEPHLAPPPPSANRRRWAANRELC